MHPQKHHPAKVPILMTHSHNKHGILMHKSTYQGVSKGIEISKYFFQNSIKLFYKIINLQLIYFKYVTSYENDI